MIQPFFGFNPTLQRQYLNAVRSGPGFICFKTTSGSFTQKHFTDEEDALSLIDTYGQDANVWVSMAAYTNPNSAREQDQAETFRSLWLDADAHDDSKHRTVNDVEVALDDFLSKSGLPKPTIIHYTGHGIQAMWTFNELLSREEWQPAADKLQELAQRMQLGIDPITADAARILRVAGTVNYRDPKDPKLATFTETGCGKHNFFDVVSALDQALKQLPPLPPNQSKHKSAKKFDSPEIDTNIDLVKAMLSAINPDTGYCEWRDVVWAVAATGWDCAYDLTHSWSSQGSSWDEDTFNRVWNSFDASRGMGFGTLVYHAKNAGYAGAYPASSVGQIQLYQNEDVALISNISLESFGDVRNAKAFATLAVGNFIYVTTRDKWLEWTPKKTWLLCEKDEHVAFAKKCCAEILAAANKVFAQDQERGRKMISDAINAHNLPRIQAMLKLAVSEPNMSVTDKSLDTDPYQIGLSNGVFDLRKGHHLFNQPEYLVTRYCNANFNYSAKCPLWITFLNQVFDNDQETIECVQRLLGYTLTGLVTEEILVICYGIGSNGKSVFSNIIHQILGGYATTAPSSLLTSRRSDDASPRNDLAALAGARYVSINELQAGDRLDEQVVKMLAGREPISARFLHREFFEYMPTFTAWLRTNHKPIITGEDDGIWRRLVILKFDRKFTESEKDPFLEGKLLEERDGILQWMLEGTRMYLTDGLKLSQRIRSENATYRKDSDLLGEFLSDVMEVDPTEKINQQIAYQHLNNWCKDNGFRNFSKKSFTQRLYERGFIESKSSNTRFYVGLKLRKV